MSLRTRDTSYMYAFNVRNGRRSVSVEAMLLDRLQRRLCLLTCDRSGMTGDCFAVAFVVMAEVW